MEKISSILPSSARITSVDMKEGAALRPGVPSFGRQEGQSGRIRDRATISPGETAMQAGEIQKKQLNWRDKDEAQATIAKELTRGFFGQTRKESELEASSAKTEMENGNSDREPPSVRGGERLAVAAATHDSGVPAPARASRPAGFHLDDVTSVMKARDFHPEIDFDDDEVKSSVSELNYAPKQAKSSESSRRQPDGLYPKGSFIDRTA